ncbi:hypothetical protein HY837_04815, partial [archaeon]|nr:hypothetical protein [archaeon]
MSKKQFNQKLKNKTTIAVFLVLLIIGLIIIAPYVLINSRSNINTGDNNKKNSNFSALLNLSKDECNLSFSEWFEQYNEKWNFTKTNIKCIFEKTCNGTFYYEIIIDSKENIFQINATLSKYGNITSVSKRLYKSFISFENNDIHKIINFYNSSYIKEISLHMIKSDYNRTITEEDWNYCETDNDCVEIVAGCCCQSFTPVNKYYTKEWNLKNQPNCKGVGCIECWTLIPRTPRCINHTCVHATPSTSPCDMPEYNSCKN